MLLGLPMLLGLLCRYESVRSLAVDTERVGRFLLFVSFWDWLFWCWGRGTQGINDGLFCGIRVIWVRLDVDVAGNVWVNFEG